MISSAHRFRVGLAGGTFAVASIAASSTSSSTQQTVPIVDLPTANARTNVTVGGVLGLREFANGKVLVNDAGRRQLLQFDTTLTTRRVVFDSVDGLPNSYGVIGVPLVPYVGDSSLMADLTGGPSTLLVLDGDGKIARTLALPSAEAGSFAGSMAATDNKGRLVYLITGRIMMPAAGTIGAQDVFIDSNPLMRVDLDLRRTDTVARIAKNKGEYAKIDRTTEKKILRTIIVNPLPEPDNWAMMTDGTIALVRGHDYHVDFLHADGTKSSTEKLPFDWKRVTDEDKQKLIDSAMKAHADQNALAKATRDAPPPPPPPIDDATGGRQRTGGGAGVTHAAYDAGGNLWVPLNYETVSPKDMADYYPAVRAGAAMADNDNQLWVLPTTSAQSRKGELVYDVINAKGELSERVRLPVGRLIAGFGKGGVVYMLNGDKKNGFYLERTRLPQSKR